VIVGAGQQVSIAAQVSVVGGGAAVPGAQLDYTLNIVNTGVVPAYNVFVSDNLNGTIPGALTYVNQSATVNDSPARGSFAGSTLTVNSGAINPPLPPGATFVVKFRATLSSGLTLGTVVTNTSVVTWGNPTQTASASVSITVGASAPGAPGVILAVLNGAAWY